MPVMVLAAGLGTRLRPLTDELPKPLVPIGDRPAIFHVIDRMTGLGRVVVNAFHFADELEATLAGRSVAVSRESALLGTAGGVARAASLLGEGDVLVWNADVLVGLDPKALIAAHKASDREATLVVRPTGEAGTGNVGLDAGGNVVRLRRETFGSGELRGADFLGIHVVGSTLRNALPETGCLVGDVYIPRGHRGARLVAYETELSFVDIGSIASYFTANASWLASRGITSWIGGEVGEKVRVGNDVVIGAGARVEGDGTVTRSIVWPGAIARAPLADVIVTPTKRVPIA